MTKQFKKIDTCTKDSRCTPEPGEHTVTVELEVRADGQTWRVAGRGSDFDYAEDDAQNHADAYFDLGDRTLRTVDVEFGKCYTAKAAIVLALPLRGEHDDLIVTIRNWSAEVSTSAPVAEAIAVGDPDALTQALGIPESVTLTSDGRDANPKEWCKCRAPEWVRYERWTARGREAHGFICRNVLCRRLLQSG